jgi:hypothetical protein
VLEMPFDKPKIKGSVIDLSFTPNLKLKRGDCFVCEPVYLGVYKRNSYDAYAYKWKPVDKELAEADLGWQNKGKVVIEQEFLVDISKICKYNTGDTVCWELEAETAVILRIKQIRS